jgi:hypothetical protein
MSRKRLPISLASVTALAAFSVTAAVAQATPRFYVNGVLAGASKQSVVQFGTITMKSPFWGEIKCNVLVGAPVGNESERGVAPVNGWGTWACRMTECLRGKSFVFAEGTPKLEEINVNPSEKERRAVRGESTLPWPAHTVTTAEATTALKMGNTEKLPAEPVKFVVECPGELFQAPYEGTLQPHIINGSRNGLKPSHLAFESSEKTGYLRTPDICGGECDLATLTVEGELTMLGTSSQQLVTAE